MRHSENTKTSSLSYICITTTLNNTILNVTDMAGNTLLWASAGSVGFKGSKRSTSYAAQATAEKIAQNCLSQNLLRVHVKLKGVGFKANLEGNLLSLRIGKPQAAEFEIPSDVALKIEQNNVVA